MITSNLSNKQQRMADAYTTVTRELAETYPALAGREGETVTAKELAKVKAGKGAAKKPARTAARKTAAKKTTAKKTTGKAK